MEARLEPNPAPPPGSYVMVRRAMPAAFAGLVEDVVHYRETIAGKFRQVETASLVVPLVIGFGEEFGIGLARAPSRDEAYGSFTSGLFPGPVVIHSTGAMECVQVNFTPLGAWRFFGLPMSELAGRMVRLDELADAGLAEMQCRLGELNSPEARLDAVIAAVAVRLLRSPLRDPAIESAWSLLAMRHGDLRIDRLAARLDWSRKHLAARFRETIGVPPKTLARIMRFRRAQALARAGDDWAGIAAACGYADQAHLTREFAELAGQAPTEWRQVA